MLGKRGNVQVTVFILLAILLMGFTIFKFATTSKIVEEKIGGAEVMESFYSDEEQINFYFQETGERAAIKAYKEFASEGWYADGMQFVDGNVVFENLNPGFRENFIIAFEEKFKEEFAKYKFENSYYQRVSEYLQKGDLIAELDASGNILKFKMAAPQMIVITNNELRGSYSFEIKNKIRLDEIGLESFEKIKDAKDSCKNEGDVVKIKDCISNKIKNFESSGRESNGYYLIDLQSKKEFFIDGNKERVEFNFAMRVDSV